MRTTKEVSIPCSRWKPNSRTKNSLSSLSWENKTTRNRKEHIFLAGKSEEKQEHTWICCFCRLRRRRDCAQEDAEEDWSFNGSRRERKARKQKVSVRYSSTEFFPKNKLGEKKGEKKVNEYFNKYSYTYSLGFVGEAPRMRIFQSMLTT